MFFKQSTGEEERHSKEGITKDRGKGMRGVEKRPTRAGWKGLALFLKRK